MTLLEMTLAIAMTATVSGDDGAPSSGGPATQVAPAVAAPAEATPKHHLSTTVLGLPLNMGPGDRTLRGVAALGLAAFAAYRLGSGRGNTTLNGVLLGVALLPATTAATGYCFLYQLVGLEYSF